MYVHTYSKNTFPKVPNYTSTFKIQEGDISITYSQLYKTNMANEKITYINCVLSISASGACRRTLAGAKQRRHAVEGRILIVCDVNFTISYMYYIISR